MIYCQYLGFYNFLHLKLEFLYIGTYNKDTINKKREIKTMSLNTKKKILISGISVGLTTATAVAVGVPVSMNNHQQSSSTDVPTTNVASYPASDTFDLSLTASNDADLNSQLSTKFGNSDILSSNLTSHFSNFSKYQNVVATFDENSGSVSNKTFTLTVTPKENFKWSNGKNDGRKITVTLSKLSTTSNDPTLNKDSTESLDGTYKINYSSFGDSVKDDSTLNAYLSAGFKQENLGGSLTSVIASFVAGSAKFNGFTFEVSLTPISGHAWSDGTTTVKTKEVKINFIDAVKDASAPTTDTLKTSVNIGKVTMTSATLQEALTSILNNGSLLNGLVSKNLYNNVDLSLPSDASKDGKTFQLTLTPKAGHLWTDGSIGSKTITVTISNLVNNWDATLSATDTFTGKLSYSNQSSFTTAVCDLIEGQGNNFVNFLQNGKTYKNVNIAYAPGTPSFSTKTFKLYVTPMAGHAWADNGTTGARVVTVTVPEDKTIKVSLPSDWSLDSLAWYYDYYKSSSPKDLDAIGRMAYKDMSATLKGFDYVGVDESQASTFSPINCAYVQTLWIKLKLKDGYSWADGSSNSTRSIRVFLFSSKDMWKDFWANNNGGLDYKLTKDDNGIPTNIWVSNVLWNTNRFTSGTWDQNSDLVKQAIITDLAKSFPGWRFTISNIQSNNYSLWNYFDYWTYNIHFENIANPNLTRDVKGYIFTQTN